MKEQGFADAGFFRDLAHGAFFIAVFRKDPIAGIQDALALFQRQGEEFFVHGITSFDRGV